MVRRYRPPVQKLGNDDWWRPAYDHPPPPPQTEADKEKVEKEQRILLLEQQVKERDQLIAILKEEIEGLKRQVSIWNIMGCETKGRT